MSRWDELIARVPQDREIVGAEVGVWKGDMSVRLLKALPLLTLYLVDRWCPPQEGDPYFESLSEISWMPPEDHTEALRQTVSKVSPFQARVEFLTGNSVEMAGQVRQESLDFVFIDADHSYDGCKADIIAWLPKIKRDGGLIGGHDFNRSDKGQVRAAVMDVFGGRAPVEVSNHYCWWVRL